MGKPNVKPISFSSVGTLTAAVNGAYSAGDCLGGVLTFTDALRNTRSGILNSLTLISDGASVSPVLEILVFEVDPTDATAVGGTAATVADNSAFAWGAAAPKLLGKLDVAAADWVALDGKQIVTVDGVGLLVTSSNRNLYFVVIDTTGVTYGSSVSLVLRPAIAQD